MLVGEPRDTTRAPGQVKFRIKIGAKDASILLRVVLGRHAGRAWPGFSPSPMAPPTGGEGAAVGGSLCRATDLLLGVEAVSSSAPLVTPQGGGGGASAGRRLQRRDSEKYTPPVPAVPKPQTRWLDKRVSSSGGGRTSLGAEPAPRAALSPPDLPSSRLHPSYDSSAGSAAGGGHGAGPHAHFKPRLGRSSASGGGGWSRADDRARGRAARVHPRYAPGGMACCAEEPRRTPSRLCTLRAVRPPPAAAPAASTPAHALHASDPASDPAPPPPPPHSHSPPLTSRSCEDAAQGGAAHGDQGLHLHRAHRRVAAVDGRARLALPLHRWAHARAPRAERRAPRVERRAPPRGWAAPPARQHLARAASPAPPRRPRGRFLRRRPA